MELVKKDVVLMAILSISFFLLSTYNLGDRKIPINSWEASGNGVLVLKLNITRHISSLYVLPGGAKQVTFDIFVGHPDNWSYVTTYKDSGYYRWGRVEVNRSSQYVSFSLIGRQERINEILLTGLGNEIINLEGVEIFYDGINSTGLNNLVDEQDELKFPPTSFSQTYFDEVYYVRTAEEYIEMRERYERTHPPLGKLLIASGILLQGFNPFGWRIMNASFSTLMIPVIYLLSKAIFNNSSAAAISASLLSLDFMHFTMGRIATPEAFAVFFNLSSCLFFYLNYRSLQDEGKIHTISVILGFVMFSLAFSTKWYTIFGLTGQMFLILLLVFKNGRSSEKVLGDKIRFFLTQIFPILLFSLLLSVAIYFSTFIPDMLSGESLRDIYDLQWKMYRYHSTLEAVHPFSSAWWSWPLNIRPIWLAIDYIRENWISTIALMGNPFIWWTGTFYTILVAERVLKKRDGNCTFIMVTFLFQWLPYAFLSRCLFIYHYYINVPIMILASTYFLNEFWRDPSKRRFVILFTVIASIVFFIFYPIISGLPIPQFYRMFLRWLPSWVF